MPAAPAETRPSHRSRTPWGWRPLQALAALAAAVAAWPVARVVAYPWLSDAPAGGVQVDTGGASGAVADGRYRLDLPLMLHNRTERVVVGVELWTDAWACPGARVGLAACGRLLSTGQEFHLTLRPGEATSLPSRFDGPVPDGVRAGAEVRIVRRLENVYDDRDVTREAAMSALK